MISISRAFAHQALDDALCKIIGEHARRALVDRDDAAFCRDVHDIVESHRRASRAIDNNLPE